MRDGDKVIVQYKGKPHPARVVRAHGRKVTVQLDGPVQIVTEVAVEDIKQ